MKKFIFLIIGGVFSLAIIVYAQSGPNPITIDSYPPQITLGDPIEITGNFLATPGPGNNINSHLGPDSWPGRVIDLSTDGFDWPLHLNSWTENKIIISTKCSLGYKPCFKVGVNTFKVYYASTNPDNGDQSQEFDIDIKTPACTINSWNCGQWGSCSINGTQTRECQKYALNAVPD